VKRSIRNIGRRWIWLLPVCAALAGIVLPAALAHARAGGGEGFGGGGGFGGGSGGHSGGGGALLELIIFLIIQNPEIGIPLLIILGVGYFFTHRSVAGAITNNRIDRGMDAESDLLANQGLLNLQAADPSFDAQAFYQRVTQAFLKMQDAWCAQNLSTVDAFISDGVRERFKLEFLQAQRLGEKDRMSQIQVLSVSLAHATSDHLYDTAVVAIQASAVDQTISASTGKVLSGSDQSEPFEEYWTFLRRRGAKSTNKPGLMEGNCPNCGAALSINQSTQCPNCHAMIFSGEFDWVLTEITQASVWRPESETTIAGVDELIKKDENFSLAQLEDTASVMFWRKAATDLSGQINPLKKVCTPAFASLYTGLLKPDGNGNRTLWGHCAVGALRTLGVIIAKASPAGTSQGAGDGPAAEPMDRALLQIDWSAHRFEIKADQTIAQGADAQLFHSLLVLERKPDCQTNIHAGVSSAHCPNCGAPLGDDAADSCPFCGTVLTDGAHGWVLSAMLPMALAPAQNLLSQLSSPAMPNDGPPPPPTPQMVATAPMLVSWAAYQVLSGDAADDKFDGLLMKLGQDHGLPDQMTRQIILAGHMHSLTAPKTQSPAEARQWLGMLIQTSLEMEPMTPQTQALFNRIGQALSMGPYDIKLLINQSRGALRDRATRALQARASLNIS
jgi:Zn finger protein HypA/HybF involved in hydrogenase expression